MDDWKKSNQKNWKLLSVIGLAIDPNQKQKKFIK